MHSERTVIGRVRAGRVARAMLLPLLGGMLLLLQAGCARTIAADSAVDQYPRADDELDYWDSLETRRALTMHDALHGLLLFEDPGSEYDSFEARLTAAKMRGWMAEDVQPEPNESTTVGFVAVALCRMLGIDGGLTMHLFGPSPRYATRELVYLRMLPERTDSQSLSGLEFTDLLRKAEAWRQDRPSLLVELLESMSETEDMGDANEDGGGEEEEENPRSDEEGGNR